MSNRDFTLVQHPIRLHTSKDLAETTELTRDRNFLKGINITDRESCRRVTD